MLSSIEVLEGRLLRGDLVVAEVSDDRCRKVLSRLISRHRGALQKLEAQKRHQENTTPKIEVIGTNYKRIPEEK